MNTRNIKLIMHLYYMFYYLNCFTTRLFLSYSFILSTMTSLVYDLTMYNIISYLLSRKMDEILGNYTELDLRYLFERNTQYEDVETNPFNLADINCNYILPDKFSHNNYQCNVLHLNINGLSSKFDQLQTLLSELSDAHVEIDCVLL